jgi:hypothetical protein
VLATIGYRHWLEGAHKSEYGSNEVELLGPNRTCIDLHHTLLGVTAQPSRSWEVLSRHTEPMVVGGRSVTVLDPAARAMHLGLHVAQNGPADLKAVADIERGLAQLPFELWQEARSIARSVGADGAFAAGLRVVEAGRRVADRLELDQPRDIELILRSWSVPAEALQILRVIEAPTVVEKTRIVARKVWPTTAYMFGRIPSAKGSSARLLAARLRRLGGLPAKFGVALWNWNRARRTARRLPLTHLTSTGGKGRS